MHYKNLGLRYISSRLVESENKYYSNRFAVDWRQQKLLLHGLSQLLHCMKFSCNLEKAKYFDLLNFIRHDFMRSDTFTKVGIAIFDTWFKGEHYKDLYTL